LFAATAQDILSRHRPDGRPVWISPAVETVLGRSPSSVGGDVAAFVHPEDIATAQAALTTAAAGRAATIVIRVLHGNGDWRWFESQVVPWADPATGEMLEAHVVSRDVTDRELAAQAQRQAERRLALTLDHAPIGMALVALDGTWLQVNAALCRLVGYSRSELLARTFQDITHPDDLESDLAYVHKLVAGEIDDYSMDKRYVRADGSTVWVRLTVTLVRDDEGSPLHLIAQMLDISDRRHLEDALHGSVAELAADNATLRDANAAKNEFFAAISHELRSPLTSIIGFGDLLANHWHTLDDARKQELLSSMRGQVRRMHGLVESLLTSTLVRTGSMALHPTVVSLPATLTRVSQRCDIPVDVDCPDPCTVMADQHRLEQMIEGLLSNAEKYGAPPYSVLVRQRDDDIDIDVCDHGPGVPEEFAPYLFEPFAQASRGDRRIARGAGLGLTIVRELAAAHGGGLRYHPNQPTGACFTLTLPAAAPVTVGDPDSTSAQE
jgi:PAS domain S-box-containing protein